MIISGTDLEGAELLMEIIPIRANCHECEKVFEIEDYAFTCPSCGSREIEVISGQDLSIVQIEVD